MGIHISDTRTVRRKIYHGYWLMINSKQWPGSGIREKLATSVVRSRSRCCCNAALLLRCWVASTSSFSIACFMLSTCLLSIAFCSSYSVFCRRSCRSSASRTEHTHTQNLEEKTHCNAVCPLIKGTDVSVYNVGPRRSNFDQMHLQMNLNHLDKFSTTITQSQLLKTVENKTTNNAFTDIRLRPGIATPLSPYGPKWHHP